MVFGSSLSDVGFASGIWDAGFGGDVVSLGLFGVGPWMFGSKVGALARDGASLLLEKWKNDTWNDVSSMT